MTEEDNDKKYFHVERGVHMCQFLGLSMWANLCLGLDIEPFNFFLNYKIIALQCHVGFCIIETNNMNQPKFPSLLNLPPTLSSYSSRSSQSDRLGTKCYLAASH